MLKHVVNDLALPVLFALLGSRHSLGRQENFFRWVAAKEQNVANFTALDLV